MTRAISTTDALNRDESGLRIDTAELNTTYSQNDRDLGRLMHSLSMDEDSVLDVQQVEIHRWKCSQGGLCEKETYTHIEQAANDD